MGWCLLTPQEYIKHHLTSSDYNRFYKCVTLEDFTSEKKDNIPMTLRVNRLLAEKFKQLATKRRQNHNALFEVIFEEWLSTQAGRSQVGSEVEEAVIGLSELPDEDQAESSEKHGKRQSHGRARQK